MNRKEINMELKILIGIMGSILGSIFVEIIE
nr:MAG TPA: Protein of unknown function (DUF2951) [Caudoviricetes sp.]